MGKFTAAFLLVLFIQPVFAVELTADSDCDVEMYGIMWMDYADAKQGTWSSYCDGELISGVGVCSAQDGVYGQTLKEEPFIDTSENRNYNNIHCWCKMTAPYEGEYWVYHSYTNSETTCNGTGGAGHGICVRSCMIMWLYKQSSYGGNNYYSIGLDSHITEQDLMQYKTALFTPVGVETPCEIGISKLMVSTGDSFSLWAEKYTEPSLVVEYNNQKCYGKLESGTGTLNIQFDGAVYHVVN